MPSLPASPPLELLCCPRCHGPLEGSARLRCPACQCDFRDIAGLAWLFPDPDSAVGEWRARVHGYLAGLESQAARYRNSLTDDLTRASTRNRLKLLASACTDQSRCRLA